MQSGIPAIRAGWQPSFPGGAVTIMRTLYLCYFGLREPLVQTQVLPYLRQISQGGIAVSLLTFEPDKKHSWTGAETEEWRARLAADGIAWISLAYHKRPSLPATLYDIVMGAVTAVRYARQHNIQVFHARTHVPAAMAMLARLLTRSRLIFDIRGLVADEYVDAGIWQINSLPYKAVKFLERLAVSSSDQVVVLTEKAREWLVEQYQTDREKIEVVPCCMDFALYQNSEQKGLMLPEEKADRFEVVYAGSVNGLYLLDEMGRFFLYLRQQRPDAFLRILTKSNHIQAKSVLLNTGLDERDFEIRAVSPQDVPAWLRRARLGLSFRKPTFSQIAASPTKIPEYLAAGIPVVCNAGIGDMDLLLERTSLGAVLNDFSNEEYSRAVSQALKLADDPMIRNKCVETARSCFDLHEIGGTRYRQVYQRLLNRMSETQ